MISKFGNMTRRRPGFESGEAGAEAAKLKKFSDTGGSRRQWLSDAVRNQVLKLFGYMIKLWIASFFLLASIDGHAGWFSKAPATTYAVDPYWPKPLPNDWIFGAVSGVAVGPDDHIWLIQRPGSLTDDEKGASLNPPLSICCNPAPPVMEFDRQGNFIQAWGGPGEGYDWPTQEHSIHVDKKGFVWISASGETDGQVLKFTRDGKFVMQIGHPGPQTNDTDVTRLGRPTGIEVDDAANEVYIGDGYWNRRVIVFDATTGTFKRLWGAYGHTPDDSNRQKSLHRTAPPGEPPSSQFGNPVHFARIAKDGLVYVGDRYNDRLQVFQKDGTFIKEFIISPKTAMAGSVWAIAFSNDPEQRYLYLADGSNNQIMVLERQTGKIVSRFGRQGRYAGQFHWVHDIAIDSKGNLYTGEVDTGMRIQKFLPQ